jgi:hypothetical protein
MEPLPYGQQLAYFLVSLSDSVLAFMNNNSDPPWLNLMLIDKFKQHAEKIKGQLRVDWEECSEDFGFLLALEELRRKNVATFPSYPKDLFQLSPMNVSFSENHSLRIKDLSPLALLVIGAAVDVWYSIWARRKSTTAMNRLIVAELSPISTARFTLV